MRTYPFFATSLSPLALNQMLVIKVVVSDSRTAVGKSTLLKGESLVRNAIRALSCLHEERGLIEARSGLNVRFGRLGFDVRSSSGALLNAVVLDCFAFITESHHKLYSFDPSLEKLILCQAIGLVAENVRQLGAFWYMHINGRLSLLLFFASCLPLNVPSRGGGRSSLRGIL
jgi:hypothetical protein